jgi:ABC-type bacteriocin/lantibiotic exporter with double-glycine peptidase domain
MPWLNVPHLKQDKPGWRLSACIAMVTAYLEQPLLQNDVARWLDTDDLVGTPASRIERMARRDFDVTYNAFGSLANLEIWLNRQVPPILFILTGELSYWSFNTQHAVVLAGFTGDNAHVFDPAVETGPTTIPTNELLLAWSHFDYTYATLNIADA